ncbi:MAG: amidoligase family protein [Campylobacterales bacterium]
MPFKKLVVDKNSSGEKRRVGFEFEFGGVEIHRAAKCVQDLFGGELESESRFEHKCKSNLGEFGIKIDADMIVELKHRDFFDELGIEFKGSGVGEWIEEMIEKSALIFVPCEVVTPPIEYEDFEKIEGLRIELENIGAQGTFTNLHHAFGLHINVESPNLEAKTLLNYLRAYLLMQEFIKEVSEIDLARRITPYIDPFPPEYIREVLDIDFRPSLKELMEHYFRFNPTRNRDFDMTPIFGVVDIELTKASIKEPELLKPRPAYHYRLPNCAMGEDDWSVELEWNRFVLIEELANSHNSISQLIIEYKKIEEGSIFGKKGKKVDMIKEYLSRKS